MKHKLAELYLLIGFMAGALAVLLVWWVTG